jgi:thiol-disulfide isomerase/thioredoxin
MKCIMLIGQRLLFAAALLVSLSAGAQDQDKAEEAQKAWQEFLKASRPPGGPPPEWKGKDPTPEQIIAYELNNGLLTAKAADLARAFYEKFPAHPNAKIAREKELKLNETSVQLGNTNRLVRLQELRQSLLNSPDIPEDERIRLRLLHVQQDARALRSAGTPAVMDAMEKGARQLIKEFPGRNEPYNLLVQIAIAAAQDEDIPRAQRLAKEIEASNLPVASKNIVRNQLKRYDAVGKPFVFIALGLDGKEINLEQLKGKVVLLDFWASWCGPCMAEVPNMKKLYDEYRTQGLEIIGVNMDQDMDVLKSTVAKHGMNWLHHFDSANPDGGWAAKYGISAIPTMWLIDKRGVLRELNAREDLEAKVKKLLAEKAP